MCFGDNCAHDCHCTGDVICDGGDGDCGKAECDTGSDYQYYGPPACQRVKKSLNLTTLLNKEQFIQAYLVRSSLILDAHLSCFLSSTDEASFRPSSVFM